LKGRPVIKPSGMVQELVATAAIATTARCIGTKTQVLPPHGRPGPAS
jgi:hypothetical protein